jgi:type I restriction enzyme, S subunit
VTREVNPQLLTIPQMNVSFLEYYLRTRRHFLENVSATQTAQKNINLQVLRPLEVPVPPLDYQEKVVEQLRQIQDQIAHIGDFVAHLREVSREVANAPESLLV